MHELPRALSTLRSHGLRVTAARRLVLEALLVADGPMSAEQIAGGIGGRVPSSDISSVYRNLERMEVIGLVRHVHLGHGPGRYLIAIDDDRECLTCERCGDFRLVAPHVLDEVRRVISSSLGYRASFRHFPIVGLCGSCVSKLEAGGTVEDQGRCTAASSPAYERTSAARSWSTSGLPSSQPSRTH